MRVLIVVCLLGILLVSCTPAENAVSLTESSTDVPANSEGEQLPPEDEEDEQLPTDTPPEPVEVPLSYEVVESHTEHETRLEKRDLWESNDMCVTEKILYVTAFVTIKNTDSVSGVFTVNFLFYTYGIGSPKKATEAIDQYSESQTIELLLQPGESGVVQSSAYRVNLQLYSYSWEFEVIPSTKIVEAQE